MRTRQNLIDAYRFTTAEELELYEKVRGHGPGIAGFQQSDWQNWLDAVQRTTAASKALREGFADTPSPTESANNPGTPE